MAVYLVLVLVLADDIMDYFRDVTRLSMELMLHNIYMLLWGSVVGYLAMSAIDDKVN